MDINTFAAKYSVKVWREECGDSVVVGKDGNVYEGFNCGRLGVCLLFTNSTEVQPRTKSIGSGRIHYQSERAHRRLCNVDPEKRDSR